jgi:hypothetical protein
MDSFKQRVAKSFMAVGSIDPETVYADGLDAGLFLTQSYSGES